MTGGTVIIQPLPGIGDMVWHVPHLAALAELFGPLTMVAKARSQSHRLLGGMDWFAGHINLERGQGGHRTLRHDGVMGIVRLARDLRPHQFETAIVLHHSTRYVLSCRLAGIPRVLSYGEGLQKLASNAGPSLEPPIRGRHPIELANDFLAALGKPVADIAPGLVAPAAARESIEADYGDRAGPWIAFAVGTSEDYKQWGEHNFARLAERLPESATVFLVAGPAEAEFSDGLASHIGRPRAATAWHLPIDQTMALLERCTLLVGNDTGALNLAAAVGIPAIGVFGARPPMPGPARITAITPTEGRFDIERGMGRIDFEEVAAEVLRRL
ncbi:MAG: glycosyltransferase family 9 protein [Alphaproteobacteria bacterium]|nr:glycosyltransferase family 9 protein [Alphaproteobacteria bacterium]